MLEYCDAVHLNCETECSGPRLSPLYPDGCLPSEFRELTMVVNEPERSMKESSGEQKVVEVAAGNCRRVV